jgi:2-keto-4-pentenoate hydratase/2-oxohepta-3-ene-1,7-dioic acid hydratase in catechol pathway
MKLVRFELKADPGTARSGMVYSGKVYETDGANPVAVHEAETVRPLAPIPQPPSIRVFRLDMQPDPSDPDGLSYFYANPAAVVGSGQVVNMPSFTGELSVEPYLAAVVVQDAYGLAPDVAEGVLLGLTPMQILVARDAERQVRGPLGRSHDIAIAVGPVLTTPEELEDVTEVGELGTAFHLAVSLKVNEVERSAGRLEELALKFGSAAAFASQSCTLKEGDLLAIGPLADLAADPISLQPGDQVQLSIERLGTLVTHIGQESSSNLP